MEGRKASIIRLVREGRSVVCTGRRVGGGVGDWGRGCWGGGSERAEVCGVFRVRTRMRVRKVRMRDVVFSMLMVGFEILGVAMFDDDRGSRMVWKLSEFDGQIRRTQAVRITLRYRRMFLLLIEDL